MEFDFGYNGEGNAPDGSSPNGNTNGENITNISTGGIEHDPNGVPAEDITGEGNDNNNGNNVNNQPDNNNNDNNDNNNDEGNQKLPHNLEVGTSIEVGDESYVVAQNGDLIDKNGAVFKNANDVKEWLNQFEQDADDSNDETIDINSIQNIIGIQVTDENDKVIEFENTPSGVKAYLDAVIETKRDEHYETAINTLYQRYPFVNDMINYYITNGNSLKGFNERPDWSNIIIDQSNEAQQENIIKKAWAERKQKGNVENYLNYLKSSGTLLATAEEELEALQEADREYKAQLEAEAERIEQENNKKNEIFWNSVYDVIKGRKIAGYAIPETIVINRNGQKISATPQDFFNYLYLVDKDGKSAYVKDLEKENDEKRRDDDILRAYLKFTGGNYSDLVGMAINAEQVNKLKLRAKQTTKASVRINRPTNAPKKGASLDLGYK